MDDEGAVRFARMLATDNHQNRLLLSCHSFLRLLLFHEHERAAIPAEILHFQDGNLDAPERQAQTGKLDNLDFMLAAEKLELFQMDH